MRGLEGRVNTLSYTLADALANPGQQRKTKKIKRKEREATSSSSSSAEKPLKSKLKMSAGQVAATVLSINNSQAANTENMDVRSRLLLDATTFQGASQVDLANKVINSLRISVK